MAADEEHEERCLALLTAVKKGDLAVMEELMSANPGLGMGDAKGRTALMFAAVNGKVDAMRVLLDHPSADPAAMMMLGDDQGWIAIMIAALNGKVDAMRLLLDHPSAPAGMMMLGDDQGKTALMYAAFHGRLDAMRLLLDHPSAPAGMMMLGDDQGKTALMWAGFNGHTGVMRLLLDHPSADPAAMMELSVDAYGATALVLAARFAARALHESDPVLRSRCAPLLFLLRRIAVEPQPSDAQQAHMDQGDGGAVQGERSNELFDVDQPDDARDECVHLLVEYGAHGFDTGRPVFKRIIRECFAQARVPQRINEAVLGMAIARQP
jgi:hypothetical protein